MQARRRRAESDIRLADDLPIRANSAEDRRGGYALPMRNALLAAAIPWKKQ